MPHYLKSKRVLLLTFIGIATLFLLINGRGTPILTKTVFLQTDDNFVIIPNAIAPTPEGGYIVAGEAHGCWVAKLDSEGHQLWTYTEPLPPPPMGYGIPDFNGIQQMQDGTIFLTGHTIVSQNDSKQTRNLLVHLDANGSLISKSYISAYKGEDDMGIDTKGCIAWNDGLVILNVFARHLPPTPSHFDNLQQFYYLLFLNNKGEKVWDLEIPSAVVSIGVDITQPIIGKDNCLYFSMTDNLQTEIVKVSPDKTVIKEFFQNRLIPIFPLKADGSLQYLKTLGVESKGNQDSSLITLNSDLKITGKVAGKPEGDFYPYAIYRLSDDSLCLFGESVHTFGAPIKAGALHLSADLKSEKLLDLEDSKFLIAGWIPVASPASTENTFLAPMPARAFHPNTNSVRGLLLNFVTVK